MTIIGSAAHLSMCACGGHGKIIAANGTSSPQIYSKEAARVVLCQLAEKGEVAEYEMGEVLRQINASPLAFTDNDAGPIDRITAKILNIRERAICTSRSGAEPSPPPKWVN